jgi:Lrp/AsnC family leucine-responsive transcriptional regulator
MTLDSEKLLDEIGWKIVRELQANARLSFAELGRRVGLSIPAVTERVHRMEDAGIITGYHAEVDLEKIGRPITAFIRMSITGDAPRLTARLKEMPEIIECHRGTGGDSFILKASLASVHHLEKLIDGLLPFGMTTTSIVLSSPVVKRFVEPPEEENQESRSRFQSERKKK